MKKLTALFFAWALAFTVAQPPRLNAQYVQYGYNKGGGGGGGSFAFVNQQLGTGTTITVTCATGELCVLFIGISGATSAVNTFSDGTGDTWTDAGQGPNNASSNETYDIRYISQPAHSGSHGITISYTNSGVGTKLINMEFTGQFTGGAPLDVCATGQGSSTNPSVSITAGAANELLVVSMVSTDSSAAAGSGFTMGTSSPAGTHFSEYWEYNLAAASGSNTAGYTRGSAINYSINACLFKHN